MHCTHECNVHKIFFLHSDLEFENLSINCYFVRRDTYLVPYRIPNVSYNIEHFFESGSLFVALELNLSKTKSFVIIEIENNSGCALK